jgi:processive 1,2-diacylglycerol beta-glucosyltransferase
MKSRALIFYISRFSGHYHAAVAVEKGLFQLNEDAEIKKINTFEYTNPILGRVINKAYIEVIKKKPEIWGNIYDNPDVLEKIKKARATLHKFNMTKIKKLITKFTPDVAICTQAFPAGMIADYKRVTGIYLPLISVLTDHAPHSYWLFDEVDHFVVPARETGDVLIKKGIPARKIKVYGIPVDPKFARKNDVSWMKQDLGLTGSGPIILIMGGNQGLGAMEEVVKSLLKDKDHKYQLIIVAGSNKSLYYRLTRLAEIIPERNMAVLPYVDNIDELMDLSDAIVTKAGGMTTSEALIKNLPVFVVSPIPGQEKFNSEYLVNKGVAIEIEDLESVHDKINQLFDDREFLCVMKEKIKEIARPDSALDIARLALGNMEDKR